jgi:hypothetical protein
VLNAASQYRGLDNITVYPAGSNANAAPIATIGTDQNAMNSADAIATDSAGEIYVANTLGGADDNGSITIFAPRTNGDATPARTIRGASTGIDDPVGLAIDSSGYLYVLNQSGGPDASGSVTVYSPHSNGDVAPVRTISGIRSSNRTGFDNPSGLALDRSDKIYVTNEGDIDSLTIYAARSEGNVAPIATISGPLTQLAKPNGIAVDSIGNVYVANSASGYGKDPDSLTVYPPGSRGNVAPAMRLSNGSILSGAVIKGSLTGLDEPVGIALGPGP